MGKVLGFDPDRPLSTEAAAKRIRTLWREGSVTWSPHCEERLVERGLSMLDIENVVRYGRVIEHARPGKLWRYKMQGRTVEGKPASAVFELAANLLTVVTVMLSRR